MSSYERIKKLANDKKMSMSDVERGAGITASTSKNWKKSFPSVENLFAVADFFEVDPRYIYNGEIKSYDLPADQREFLNKFNQLPIKQQDTFQKMLDDSLELLARQEEIMNTNKELVKEIKKLTKTNERLSQQNAEFVKSNSKSISNNNDNQ